MLVCCARNYVAVKFKMPFDVGSFASIHTVDTYIYQTDVESRLKEN